MKILRGHSVLVFPGLIALVLFFLIPVVLIFQTSFFDPEFTLKHFERLIEREIYIIVFLRTLNVSLIVALLCLIIGYPAAYFILRQPPRRRAVLLFLVLVPLWMSILIRTYAWMVVLGRNGIINSTLLSLGIIDEPAKLLFTTGAVYVAMVQVLLPIMILTCFVSMTEIDWNLIKAARVLGAGPLRAFMLVFLPLSLQGALNGTLIVFILSIGFFITPALIGGRRDAMLTNLIADQIGRANWGFAGAMSILLLLATLVVLFVSGVISKKYIYSTATDGSQS